MHQRESSLMGSLDPSGQPPSEGRYYLNFYAAWALPLLAIAFLSLMASAQVDECYYPGMTYKFNTTYDEDWVYKWTATDGTFDYDNRSVANWTAPVTEMEKNVTLRVLAYNNVTLDQLSESCIAMDDLEITLCPLANLTVVKNSVPDDPQDFQFLGTGSIGAFVLDDDGGLDATYSDNQTFRLLPGTYSITETVEAGWMLTAVTCTDSGGNDVPVVLSQALAAYGPVDVTATIESQYVTSGSSLTIVFENTKVNPGISLIKKTNGEDANNPTGPYIPLGDQVTWTYEVNNTGNVNLTNVQVTDNITGFIGTIDLLEPGQSQILTKIGTALEGQYSNIGNATGTPPVGTDVSDEDPSHYYGSNGSINIEKYTNGEDADSPTGPYIPAGDQVTWAYEVTNTGNVNLTNVQVTDNITGFIGTIDLLEPGQTQILTKIGTALEGQYANMGNATGTPPNGTDVSDEDPSHYFG